MKVEIREIGDDVKNAEWKHREQGVDTPEEWTKDAGGNAGAALTFYRDKENFSPIMGGFSVGDLDMSIFYDAGNLTLDQMKVATDQILEMMMKMYEAVTE